MRLRRSFTTLLCLLLPLTLSSCQLWTTILGVPGDCDRYRESIDFASDSRILRGSWEGVVEDYPSESLKTTLQLELSARYEDRTSYAISGTFKFGDEPARRLEGSVSAGCFEVYTQSVTAERSIDAGELELAASPPPPAGMSAEVYDDDGSLLWTLQASWGGFTGDQPPPEMSLSGSLRQEGSPAHAYNFFIERSSASQGVIPCASAKVSYSFLASICPCCSRPAIF